MLLWTQRKFSRRWVREFDQPQQLGLGRKCGGGPFYVALVRDSTLSLTAEATTKSHSQSLVSKSVCFKNDHVFPHMRERAATHALVSLSVCACVVDGCVGWEPKSFHFHQVQGISHTSSIFFQQYRSTVALCVYFPDFNWACTVITLSEGNYTELSKWKFYNKNRTLALLLYCSLPGCQSKQLHTNF